VVTVGVSNKEIRDMGQREAEDIQPSNQLLLAVLERPTGVDHYDTIAVDDRVHVDGSQAVVRQRQRNPEDTW